MKIARGELEQLADVKTFPDQTPYKSLSVHHVLELSRRPGLSGWEIEISALENGIVPERYARNMRTFSLEDQTDCSRRTSASSVSAAWAALWPRSWHEWVSAA